MSCYTLNLTKFPWVEETSERKSLFCYPFSIASWDTNIIIATMLFGNVFVGWSFRLFPYKGQRYGCTRDLFSIALPVLWFGVCLNLWREFTEYLLDAIVVYLLVYADRWFPSRKAWMPWSVFLFTMGHLMYLNMLAYRTDFTNEKLDMRTPIMISVMKLTRFAWSCYDGRRDREKLRPDEYENRVVNLPQIQEYFSFFLFFPGIYTGPSFTYVEYNDFQTGVLKTAEQKYSEQKHKSKLSSLYATLNNVAYGLAELLLYYFTDPWFRTNYIRYINYHLPTKIMLTLMFGFESRCKYYGAWSVAEAGFIAAGFGFNPKSNKYDLAENVRPWKIETAQSVHGYISNWNINTSLWLRTTIYNRLTPLNKKPSPLAFYTVFVVSALWHGPHITYMMSFVLVAVYQSLANKVRRTIRPRILAAHSKALKTLYDLAGFIYTQVTVIFYLLPFLILYLDPVLVVWKSLDFYGLYLVFVPMSFFLLASLFKDKKGKKVKKA